jgi:DNA polymerase III subunit epsilon
MRLRRSRGPSSAAAQAYENASRPSAATPWTDAHYVVVDLETTGLDARHDEIISFASIPIDAGRAIVRGIRTAMIRPVQMPPPETIRIHGLRPVDLTTAPPLSDVLELILEALTGRVLVAHAAWVEREFLQAALKPEGLRLAEPVLDTASIAAEVLGLARRGEGAPPPLAEVARELELPVHRPHVAEGDALTTAQVFLALAARLDLLESQTVGTLAGLSGE